MEYKKRMNYVIKQIEFLGYVSDMNYHKYIIRPSRVKKSIYALNYDFKRWNRLNKCGNDIVKLKQYARELVDEPYNGSSIYKLTFERPLPRLKRYIDDAYVIKLNGTIII